MKDLKDLFTGMRPEDFAELKRRYPMLVTDPETLELLSENCFRMAMDMALNIFTHCVKHPDAERQFILAVPPFQPVREKVEARRAEKQGELLLKQRDGSDSYQPTQAAAKA